MNKIDPSAHIASNAEIASDVEIGANAVIENNVRIGPGCIIRPMAIVRQYTTLGSNNYIDSFVVLGSKPQDLKFNPKTVSYLEIGDHNSFRDNHFTGYR